MDLDQATRAHLLVEQFWDEQSVFHLNQELPLVMKSMESEPEHDKRFYLPTSQY